jgi:REP element-mobilizing transposase RayT
MQYRRHRPHWFPENRAVFITWRLFGSAALAEVHRVLRCIEMKAPLRFAKLDAVLDQAEHGPKWLANPEIAKLVRASLLRGEQEQHYELDSYVVMANHVHMLVWPLVPVQRLMRSLKSYSAREANKILGRTGRSFWQDESFDHWCRHEAQHLKIRAYIENNPVKAGLVARPEDWKWSSASPDGMPPRRRATDDTLLKRYHP